MLCLKTGFGFMKDNRKLNHYAMKVDMFGFRMKFN